MATQECFSATQIEFFWNSVRTRRGPNLLIGGTNICPRFFHNPICNINITAILLHLNLVLLTMATPSCKRKADSDSTSEERESIVSSAKMHARKLQAVSNFALVQARWVVAPPNLVIGADIPP